MVAQIACSQILKAQLEALGRSYTTASDAVDQHVWGLPQNAWGAGLRRRPIEDFAPKNRSPASSIVGD
jgi:hypothetical protein